MDTSPAPRSDREGACSSRSRLRQEPRQRRIRWNHLSLEERGVVVRSRASPHPDELTSRWSEPTITVSGSALTKFLSERQRYLAWYLPLGTIGLRHAPPVAGVRRL